jgi:GAF domain-containing protein
LNRTEGTGTGTDSGTHVAQHLADIARILLAPGSVAETLNLIVTMSVASIDGCDEAGLTELTPGAVTSVPTSPLVADLDRLQDSLGEGPCLDVLAGLDSVYVDDLSDSPIWPHFGPAAAQAGVRSALAYRLFADSGTLGALVMYARLPGAFNATDRTQGLIFAAHASMALSVAQNQASERGRTSNLQTALLSREIIGQAQGILMERERITADQAFDLLRRSSQHLNVKLRDVAQELVDTGAVPGEIP